MKKIRVSIIIPVYNVAEYLSKCIESILGQVECNWELILVDDGSNDESGSICDRYASQDSRITVVHKKNEGVSIARNLGISLAKADWICFVDSDDWVEPGYIAEMLALADDEHTIVYGNLIHDYVNGQPSVIGCNYDGKSSCNLYSKDAADFIVHNRIIEIGYPVAKMFNKKILVNKGIYFNPRISLHEDHIFVLQYLLSARYIALSITPNYHYTHRSTSSLSKKKHPTKNLILAAEELICTVKIVITQYSINDATYVKRLYTLLGLNQLVKAALSADKHEIKMAGYAIRKYKRYFVEYYSPNHKYIKLIPVMFFFKLDKLVLWINRLLGTLI